MGDSGLFGVGLLLLIIVEQWELQALAALQKGLHEPRTSEELQGEQSIQLALVFVCFGVWSVILFGILNLCLRVTDRRARLVQADFDLRHAAFLQLLNGRS